MVEINETERKQIKNNFKKIEDNLRDLWDNVKRPNIQTIGVPEKTKRMTMRKYLRR